MPPILEKVLFAPWVPGHAPREGHGTSLDITVLFTTVEPTIGALRKAGQLAAQLGARITLLVPQVVPYPLELTSPPVLVDFEERRFRVIAEHCPIETIVRIYLCRDREQTLEAVLEKGSLVVVGSRRCWWPTREWRLARRLRSKGHEVILAEME